MPLFFPKRNYLLINLFDLQIQLEESEINTYHENFLCWQQCRINSSNDFVLRSNQWKTKNKQFYGHETPQLLRKNHIEDRVIKCSLSSLLCCRLREGYLIKKMSVRDSCLEICFILPWTTHVFIEYLVTQPKFTKSLSVCNTMQYTITFEAPYEFLHDITCLSKKPLKSIYRQNVVSRFWSALTSLTESDTMLEHFSWFPGKGWTWYNVPDTIKSGMPVFYLPSTSSAFMQIR